MSKKYTTIMQINEIESRITLHYVKWSWRKFAWVAGEAKWRGSNTVWYNEMTGRMAGTTMSYRLLAIWKLNQWEKERE